MEKITRKELFKLFLIIAFPIHTWSIILIFYNFEWIAERTIIWGAIGYSAYALAFALFESILSFILVLPIYLLLRKKRDVNTTQAIIGSVYLIISIWEIINRINISNSHILETTILQIGSNLKIRYRYKIAILFLVIAGPIAVSIGLTPFLISKYDKLKSISIDVFQRIELLSYIYLTLDLLSIFIIIIRNVSL
jgi:hypothetical protein